MAFKLELDWRTMNLFQLFRIGLSNALQLSLVGAPLVLTVLCAFNIYFNGFGELLRGSLLLGSFMVGGISPLTGILLGVFSCVLFESLTLGLELPNQFLHEVVFIGVMGGNSLRKLMVDRSSFDLDKRVFLHPMVLYCCFLLGYAAILVTFFVKQLNIYYPITYKYFLRSVVQNLMVWDVQRNPYHFLSVAFGVLVNSLFIVLAGSFLRNGKLTLRLLVLTLMATVVPCYVFAVGQYLSPYGMLTKYATGISGSFQNGNHLSFYASIISILSIYSWLSLERSKGLSILTLFLSLQLMIVGGGRTAWVAAGLAAFLCFVFLRQASLLTFCRLSSSLWLSQTDLFANPKRTDGQDPSSHLVGESLYF